MVTRSRIFAVSRPCPNCAGSPVSLAGDECTSGSSLMRTRRSSVSPVNRLVGFRERPCGRCRLSRHECPPHGSSSATLMGLIRSARSSPRLSRSSRAVACLFCRHVSCSLISVVNLVRFGSIRLASGSAVDLGPNCPWGSALLSSLGAGFVRPSMNLVIFAFLPWIDSSSIAKSFTPSGRAVLHLAHVGVFSSQGWRQWEQIQYLGSSCGEWRAQAR